MKRNFSTRLLAWFERHGRHDLPWQHPREPYRVWLAEIMLQQTRVATVIPYFQRFVAALPDVRALAEADEDRVLSLWSGLGYYRRAHFMHQAARRIVDHFGGGFPRDLHTLTVLPGIGRSTAAAILAQSFGLRHAILDGNVKRVLARHLGIAGWPGEARVENALWREAEIRTPQRRVADYTQAIMDLGATVCVRSAPLCGDCPLAADCVALRDGRIAELPAPRPSRRIPARDALLLVEHDTRGRVRLVKRAPTGVWPALWSLPEIECAPPQSRRIAGFEHSFTHFRLRAEICARDIGPAADGVAESVPSMLAGPDDVAAIALPAPVRSRLVRFWENEEWREP
ncbi:MAG TPA: A/G-specific adenine glycosylase [Xanthomonadaceae bacterium]|nr:A/G-specific adenine glycosylase [Xanthomonadaceae bacterium]